MPNWRTKLLVKESAKKETTMPLGIGRVARTVVNWSGLSGDALQESGSKMIYDAANDYIGYDIDESRVYSSVIVNKVSEVKASEALRNQVQRLSELTGVQITPELLKNRLLKEVVSDKDFKRKKNKEVRDALFPNYLNKIYKETLKEIYRSDSMKNPQGLSTEAAYNKICGAAMLLGAAIEQYAIDLSNDPGCNSFLSRPTSFIPTQKENEEKYKRSSFASLDFVKEAVNAECKRIKPMPGESKPDFSKLFSDYVSAHSADLSVVKSEDYWVKTEEDRLNPSFFSYIKRDYLKWGALKVCDYLGSKALSYTTGMIDDFFDPTRRTHSVKPGAVLIP